jgi:hypothetical protein
MIIKIMKQNYKKLFIVIRGKILVIFKYFFFPVPSNAFLNKEEGINRAIVADLELEPMVQVGAASDISGFPKRACTQYHGQSPEWYN